MNAARRADQRLQPHCGQRLYKPPGNGLIVFALLIRQVYKVRVHAAAFQKAEAL